jgi:hypothetical protein
MLPSATGTRLDASREAGRTFPRVFDKVKSAFSTADERVLQRKYSSHASDFGIEGNWNSTNRELFRRALNRHVRSSETVPGWFRGDPVYHHYNPGTGLNV